MHRLEAALGIVPDDLDNYQRLRRIANQVILKIEDEANLDDDGTLDWNQRIERLRQVFVKKCESAFELEPSENLPVRERVYKVQALLEDLDLIDSPDGTDVTTVLGPNQLNPQDVYWDTIRLLNFDAIYDGYVAEAPTPERFLDTLMRIEREVFHLVNAQPKAPRQACVEVCEPINLKDYLSDYRRERSSTVDRLASELHQIMQSYYQNHSVIAYVCGFTSPTPKYYLQSWALDRGNLIQTCFVCIRRFVQVGCWSAITSFHQGWFLGYCSHRLSFLTFYGSFASSQENVSLAFEFGLAVATCP